MLLREVYVLATAHMWKSVDDLWKSVLSHEGPKSLRYYSGFQACQKVPTHGVILPTQPYSFSFQCQRETKFQGIDLSFFFSVRIVLGHKVQYPEVSWKENTLWKIHHYRSIGPLWAYNMVRKHTVTGILIVWCVLVYLLPWLLVDRKAVE